MSKQKQQRIAVVTGATSGIGLATLQGLASEGHCLIGVARNAKKAEVTRQAVLAQHPGAHLTFLLADLSSQTQIRTLAEAIEKTINLWGFNHLDTLVNDAGAVTSWFTLTEDGYELQFAVNHLAPFLLTHALLPLLQAAPQGRVITVSSASHRNTRMHWKDVMLRKSYGTLRAYKQSKLANVLFTLEFNRQQGPDGSVKAYAVDPGLVQTGIGAKGTSGFVSWFWTNRSKHGVSPAIAAETIIYLASRAELPYTNAAYFKQCHPIAPSRYAQKEEPAARLWALSEKLCGLNTLKNNG